MERVPISELEPDFGIAEAYKISEYVWRRAKEERSLYLREDTSEIPRKMLDASKPVTVDDVYAMLNVYYWWQEEWQDPVDYLDDLLEDLTFEQAKQALRALHTAFPERCDYDILSGQTSQKSPCQKTDGWICFTNLMDRYGNKTPEKLKSDDLAEEITMFFGEFLDKEGDSILDVELNKYNYRKLGQAGLTELECSYAEQVIKIESDRREGGLAFYDLFCKHINNGGDMEEFMATVLPNTLAENTGYFNFVADEYEDIPDDWPNWDITKKLALARRFVAENKDHYQLLMSSYESEIYGIVPPYLYAMRPDHVFPGEI